MNTGHQQVKNLGTDFHYSWIQKTMLSISEAGEKSLLCPNLADVDGQLVVSKESLPEQSVSYVMHPQGLRSNMQSV